MGSPIWLWALLILISNSTPLILDPLHSEKISHSTNWRAISVASETLGWSRWQKKGFFRNCLFRWRVTRMKKGETKWNEQKKIKEKKGWWRVCMKLEKKRRKKSEVDSTKRKREPSFSARREVCGNVKRQQWIKDSGGWEPKYVSLRVGKELVWRFVKMLWRPEIYRFGADSERDEIDGPWIRLDARDKSAQGREIEVVQKDWDWEREKGFDRRRKEMKVIERV